MKPFVCLVQPPFVQLNSPYPAPYYLRSFLERRGHAVLVRDHSIGLFEQIFCRTGLERIFADVKKMRGTVAHNANLLVERFLSDEDRWLSTIDRTVNFLRGRDREWGHCIALANGALPEGVRFYMHLAANSGEASPDEAPLLASKLIADIADFITNTLDANFSLIRYTPNPAAMSAGFRDFAPVQNSLDGYVMRNFYRPLLEVEWNAIEEMAGDSFLLGCTIPFPGCLAGALACAESAKAHFGGRVVTAAGGGYVNTELRFIEEEQLFDYFDYVSFDRGYGSLDAIIRREFEDEKNDDVLYKTMYRNSQNNIVKSECINSICNTDAAGKNIDDEAAAAIFPDYSAVDFSRYICPVDDANPMHRLWSDGRWLKAYTAHGCYWHNCAFCDVHLDYIRSYKPVDAEALFRHLVTQAAETGVRGVHLVDEACPPASLLQLALLNREAGLPLLFWGNIRFEKTFTQDAAAILAAGGIIGVSAGIEVATEKGFARIGKGVGLAHVVNACAAFKEAGILVHAYLIYGYWDEEPGEIIDSAETMRQLFEAGLLDSAFWHQFSLTRYSRIYAEKLNGLHDDLRITEPAGKNGANKKLFALNDILFEGAGRFDRFAAPLDRLLAQWMRGDATGPVADAFDFKVPKPAIAPDTVSLLLDSYARKRGSASLPKGADERALFLGSRPFIHRGRRGAELHWRWRFADCALRRNPLQGESSEAWAIEAAALLEEAAHGRGLSAGTLFTRLETIFGDDANRVWKALRKQGLAVWGVV